MQSKLSTAKSFLFKALLIFGCIISVDNFNNCDAQSIVGKWNQVSTKMSLTALGVKTLGKPFILTQTASFGSVVMEFKADNRFMEKADVASNASSVTVTGTWSLEGDQLKTKLDPKQRDPKNNPKEIAQSENITVTVTGNTLIIITAIPPGENQEIIQKEDTYIKM